MKGDAGYDIAIVGSPIGWCANRHHSSGDYVGCERSALSAQRAACGAQCERGRIACGGHLQSVTYEIGPSANPRLASRSTQSWVARRKREGHAAGEVDISLPATAASL